jgi:uncharacterized protein YkwD
MKRILILILTLSILSCTKQDESITPILHTYQFSTNELELLNNINVYRNSIGLNTLQTNQHISYLCQEHNLYMIDNDVINHDYFQYRVNNLQETLDAERVGENIAYNYSTPNSTLNAWLGSPGHKENIEGDYTDFGLSITIGTNQRKYITLILIKK